MCITTKSILCVFFVIMVECQSLNQNQSIYKLLMESYINLSRYVTLRGKLINFFVVITD